jgi:hypothetical protein
MSKEGMAGPRRLSFGEMNVNRRLVLVVPAAVLSLAASATLGGSLHSRASTYATCTVTSDTLTDAPTPPIGRGQSSNLDINAVAFSLSDDAKTLKTILTIANLDTRLPTGSTANDYQVIWTAGANTYATDAEVTINPGGQPTITYAGGTLYTVNVPVVGANTEFVQNPQTRATGTFTPGASGTIEVDVPVSEVGSPKVGDILTATSGASASGAGLLYQGFETIVDGDNGTDYTVGVLSGGVC